MKTKLILAAVLLTIAHLSMAQNDFPIPTNSNVTVDGGSINFKRPVTTGGWSRGLYFYDYSTNSDRWGGIGLYGVGSDPKDIFLGHGLTPWSSSEGLHINDNGNVGVGVRFPSERLEVDGTSLFRNANFFGSASTNKIGVVDFNDAQDLFLIRATAGHKLSFGANDANNRMVIDLDGKVGIGTSTPSKNLDVFGQNTSEIKLSTSGSSYNLTLEANNDAANRWHLKSNGSGVLGNVSLVGTTPTYVRGHNGVAFLSGSGGVNDGNVQMFIKSNGEIGVGTTNPSSNFEVSNNSVNTFQVTNPDAGKACASKFYNDSNRGAQFVSYGSGYTFGSYFGVGENNGALIFNQKAAIGTIGDDDLNLGTNGSTHMTISKTGKIGIGILEPARPLHVVGAARIESYLTMGANGSSGHTASGIILESHHDFRGAGTFSQGQTAEWFWGNPYTDHDGTFIIARGLQGAGTSLAQKANALFTMTDDGNVSLGTTDVYTDYKLSVNGKIQTDEVKVHPEGQWMDIVFEEEYDLRTLEEVQKYIDENGHLPDIPSAEEVEENGFNLGEMDANLLRKIEELTLYMLEKDQAIKNLQDANALLIQRLDRMEKQMKD